jgi:protease I
MPAIAEARVLIVATDGFEEWELFGPRQLLREQGAEVLVAAPSRTPIQATVLDDAGKTIRPDLAIEEASAEEFDALILPGDLRNPDQLRMHKGAIELIRAFDGLAKPIGAICHGLGFSPKPTCCAAVPRLRGRRSGPTFAMPAQKSSTKPR